MNPWNRMIFLVATSSLILLWLLGFELIREHKQNRELIQSSDKLQLELTHLKTTNNGLMSQNQALRLSNTELQLLLPSLYQEIENLKIKQNRAKQIAISSYRVDTLIETRLRDSLIYDTVRVKLFEYDDLYLRIKGQLQDDLALFKLSYTDTLVQVVYRGEREKPWLWIFSRRKLMQRVSLKNPNARIHYSQVIEIEN